MNPRPLPRVPALLAILLAAAMLQACGWQLRGAAALPTGVSPVYIQGPAPHTRIEEAVARALKDAGTPVADRRSEAASVLHIAREESGQRLLSVDGRGKGLEYELYQTLEFGLTDASGSPLVGRQRLVASQAVLAPQIETLGKRREERELREALRRDLAERLVRRLEARLR